MVEGYFNSPNLATNTSLEKLNSSLRVRFPRERQINLEAVLQDQVKLSAAKYQSIKLGKKIRPIIASKTSVDDILAYLVTYSITINEEHHKAASQFIGESTPANNVNVNWLGPTQLEEQTQLQINSKQQQPSKKLVMELPPLTFTKRDLKVVLKNKPSGVMSAGRVVEQADSGPLAKGSEGDQISDAELTYQMKTISSEREKVIPRRLVIRRDRNQEDSNR